MRLNQLHILEALGVADAPLKLKELHERSGVPVPTLVRVLPRLQESGYVEKVGRGMYRAGAKRFHPARHERVVFEGLGGTSFDQFCDGFGPVLRRAGIEPLMMPRRQSPATELTREAAREIVERHELEGSGYAFFSDGVPGDQFTEYFAERNVSLVCVGLNHHMPFDTVCTDFEAGGEELMAMLHARGHRRIGYVAQRSLLRVPSFRARRRGYESGVARHGLTSTMLFYDHHERRRDHNPVTDWLGQLRAAGEAPTALLVGGHAMVADAVAAAFDLRLRIPKDLSIATFGRVADARATLDKRLRFDAFESQAEPWEDLGTAAAARMLTRFAVPELPPVLVHVRERPHPGRSVADISRSS